MKNEKVWLAILLFCLSLPAIAGGLHFGIIDAIKEQKEKLKEKIRKGEEYKEWQEERRKELIYVGVSDDSVPKIHVFNNLGEYVMGFGGQGTGDGEFGKPDEIFGNLPDIAVDKEKNLWVIDLPNARVQKFNKDGRFLLKFGEWGTETGKLFLPVGIATDGECNIYVVDIYISDGYIKKAKMRIQKFDKYGNFLKKFILKVGNKNLWGWALALDQENNFYASGCFEDETFSGFVYKFDQNGSLTTQFGNGEGTGTGQFKGPIDIKVDKDYNIFVLDYSLDRVQKFDKFGNFLLKFGSEGEENGQFRNPQNMDIDSNGNLYIVDSDNPLQVFTNDGRFLKRFSNIEKARCIAVNF